jgi:hypothetical protein
MIQKSNFPPSDTNHRYPSYTQHIEELCHEHVHRHQKTFECAQTSGDTSTPPPSSRNSIIGHDVSLVKKIWHISQQVWIEPHMDQFQRLINIPEAQVSLHDPNHHIQVTNLQIKQDWYRRHHQEPRQGSQFHTWSALYRHAQQSVMTWFETLVDWAMQHHANINLLPLRTLEQIQQNNRSKLPIQVCNILRASVHCPDVEITTSFTTNESGIPGTDFARFVYRGTRTVFYCHYIGT